MGHHSINMFEVRGVKVYVSDCNREYNGRIKENTEKFIKMMEDEKTLLNPVEMIFVKNYICSVLGYNSYYDCKRNGFVYKKSTRQIRNKKGDDIDFGVSPPYGMFPGAFRGVF